MEKRLVKFPPLSVMHRVTLLLAASIVQLSLLFLSSLPRSLLVSVWQPAHRGPARRRTRVLSTVRRRRELSATRARAAREPPTEREDDFAWNMQAPGFSPPRPPFYFSFFLSFFFPSVPGSIIHLDSIDSSLHEFHLPLAEQTRFLLREFSTRVSREALREYRLSCFLRPRNVINFKFNWTVSNTFPLTFIIFVRHVIDVQQCVFTDLDDFFFFF